MSKIKNGGLDQCGAEPLEQQQFGTADIERVNSFGTEGLNTFLSSGVIHSQTLSSAAKNKLGLLMEGGPYANVRISLCPCIPQGQGDKNVTNYPDTQVACLLSV